MKKRRSRVLHFVGLDCCKQGLFDSPKQLRKTTNPADVTCSNCIRRMSKYLIEYRNQILNARKKRKEKVLNKK